MVCVCYYSHPRSCCNTEWPRAANEPNSHFSGLDAGFKELFKLSVQTTDHRESYSVIYGNANDFRLFPVSTEQSCEVLPHSMIL